MLLLLLLFSTSKSTFYICVCAKSLQLYQTLCDPMDRSPPGSSVRGILQARILEWVAMPSSRGSSRPGDWTCVSCVGRVVLYHQCHLGSPHFTCTSAQSTVLSFEVSKDLRHGSCCDGFKSREDKELEPQTQLQKWMCVSSSNMSRPGRSWGTWRKQRLLESQKLMEGLLKCGDSLGNGQQG